MDVWEAIAARRSVRNFDVQRDVPPKVVERILQAAIRAPSAGNRQPWHFVVVRSSQVKTALALAAWGQYFVAQAPVVIVVCAEPKRSAGRYGERGVDLYCLQDTAAAAEHILLTATALGLGTCWVGAFDEPEVAQALNLDGEHRPVAIIPLGYAVDEPTGLSSRRALEEVVEFVT